MKKFMFVFAVLLGLTLVSNGVVFPQESEMVEISGKGKPPAHLWVQALSSSSIRLYWEYNIKQPFWPTMIEICRKTKGSGNFKPIDTIIASPGVTSYDDKGLEAGTRYMYKLRLYNDSHSDWSNEDHTNTLTFEGQPVADCFTEKKGELTIFYSGRKSHDTNKGGWIYDYIWDFGDGTVLSGPVEGEHTYQNYGTYTITLRVVDNDRNVSEPDTCGTEQFKKKKEPPECDIEVLDFKLRAGMWIYDEINKIWEKRIVINWETSGEFPDGYFMLVYSYDDDDKVLEVENVKEGKKFRNKTEYQFGFDTAALGKTISFQLLWYCDGPCPRIFESRSILIPDDPPLTPEIELNSTFSGKSKTRKVIKD